MHLNKNKLLTSSEILVEIDRIINKFWNEKLKLLNQYLMTLYCLKF